MKYKLLTLIFLLSVSPLAYAQQTALPDIYIKNFNFSKCSQQTIDYALTNSIYKYQIINTAPDGSYFDVSVKDPTQPTVDIRRTLCYSYEIANRGTTTFVSNISSATGDNLWENFYITDQNWTTAFSYQGQTVFQTLKPGESYTDSGSIEVDLNENQNNKCVGLGLQFMKGDFISAQSDATNNRSLLCYNVDYSFPGTPQNFSATKADARNLSLTWDKVPDAQTYEIEALDYAPNKGGETISKSKITDNNFIFQFPNDDLYCLMMRSVKDGILSAPSQSLCYGALIPIFKDVPISSWYFPYLQQLQANAIISGYKNSKGQDLGIFGPSNNLTVAETLKMGFTALGPSTISGENTADLPTNLRNHWAAKFIERGHLKNLTILKNLSTFNPDRSITRGELVQVLTEIKGDKIPQYNQYTATDIAGSPYSNIIEYAYKRGFISGYPDGTFKPDTLLNRAEIIKILSNFKRYS